MDKIKNAAIIILGMGEKCASEILRNMTPQEVRRIMEAINEIESVSEEDVIRALNHFFRESNSSAGFDLTSKEHLKNSLASVLGMKGLDGADGQVARWIDLLRNEPVSSIIELIQDEHPQIITSVIVILSQIGSDKASGIMKEFPKEMQNEIIKKMTRMTPISSFAIDTLSQYFEEQLAVNEDRYNVVSVDGIEAAANIISYLDTETEREIISDISNTNKVLAEKIQDKMLPFEKIAQLDRKSLQILLAEVKNEDLILALKGVDDYLKNIFMKSMSTKSAEILKDEMESMGPVRLARVVEAQKKIIQLAKKLGKEEKIILSTKQDGDVIF